MQPYSPLCSDYKDIHERDTAALDRDRGRQVRDCGRALLPLDVVIVDRHGAQSGTQRPPEWEHTGPALTVRICND